MIDVNPEHLRQSLHWAQKELAPVARDGIYETNNLRHLIYHWLPELVDQLRDERDAR